LAFSLLKGETKAKAKPRARSASHVFLATSV
jgi:hypothetical protein